MRCTPTFCAVTILVMALSVASAGAFACQIDCAVAPAPPTSHTSTCGGHAQMPAHEKDSHQHSGHTHNRIIAAAQSNIPQTSLQQGGLLPHAARGVSALADVNHTQEIATSEAKSPLLIFITPVLRI